MLRAALAFAICLLAGIVGPALALDGKADLVWVKKSEGRLYLFNDGAVIAEFPVVFGGQPRGHKQREGDQRTPEGDYLLDYKNADSAYFKSIRISYPNAQDVERARRRGVDPGGAIMIHGQKNGYGMFAAVAQLRNWTDGCIALTDQDMQKVWDAVEVGTPIRIEP